MRRAHERSHFLNREGKMKKSTFKIEEGLIPRTPGQLVSGKIVRLIHPETGTSKNFAISCLMMNPGDKVKPHYHINGKEEAYFILSGTGEITHKHRTTGEVEEIKIEKNMAIYIEPEMIHDIRCTGNEPLWLLVMSYPPMIGETAKLANAEERSAV
jgi:mannose-6-phosphate isomerase-like protein (cupin superfamily)